MPKKPQIGPSWAEVILAAILSVALGIVLGATYLVLKPVTTVRELPKEPVADAIYYIEGTHDGTKGRQYSAKRQAFAKGESVTVNEDEINLFVASTQPVPAPAAPKPKPKPGEKEPMVQAEAKIDPPNFRLQDGLMQIAVPVKVGAFGLETTIVIFAKGTFVKEDSGFVFEPSTFWAGSCSLDRLPIVNSMVFQKFFGSQPVPEDISASWAKLVGVHVEGSTLKLMMP